ncbi:MAG: tRNA 2-thiouridine(34) synthase MnmA [Firmicutes bacterium]|nr:tRNA 2-thiouridine(34) synthase MnmA [Bacillota bacterium]
MNTIMEISKNNKVLLGLSGGVDSTTAALLLKEQGFEVYGYYFDVMGTNEISKKEAQEVADQLGIELITEDVSKEFEEKIIGNFIDEYISGRTPNPCVVCNPLIKFKKLIECADREGIYFIATGHYCRIVADGRTGNFYVRKAANAKKDQSYMLCRLGQDVLRRLIFPLGEFLDKDEIRTLARDNNLQNADKKDSQEICFIDDEVGYAKYIQDLGYKAVPGEFVDKDGKVLGQHKGIINYTIGQRKGLGIAIGKPAFVTKIDAGKNQIVIGDNADLFTTKVVCSNYSFAANDAKEYDGKIVMAKVRYSAQPMEAFLEVDDNVITATFETPQRAATPGQSIVFYVDEKVIGGGFIE